MVSKFVIAGFVLSVMAHADVVQVATRSEFNALGTIVFNSNFDDFGAGFHYPGDAFTRGDVTYTSETNLTVGSGTSYSIGASRTVLTNDYWTPVPGDISTATNLYDLFGFDLAVTSGLVDVTLFTNTGSKLFAGLTVPDGSPSFLFLGFATTAGEHFTGFRIDTQGSSFLPGMTDVAVGVQGVAPVPEPTTALLTGMAAAGLLFARKRFGIR